MPYEHDVFVPVKLVGCADHSCTYTDCANGGVQKLSRLTDGSYCAVTGNGSSQVGGAVATWQSSESAIQLWPG